MASQLLLFAAILWVVAAIVGLGGALVLARIALAAGAIAGAVAAIIILPEPSHAIILPSQLVGESITFRVDAEGLWLMGFGLVPAGFACALASPSRDGMRGWLLGASTSLLGALGVFGLQNGAGLLIAWEAMSLGGAVMILSENLEPARGRTVLFMLALLEVGAVALVLAIAILGFHASALDFAQFDSGSATLSHPVQIGLGLLLLIGFGAKLGLLPFYEWFPGAYGSASGATGAIMSGVVLNAAFFALSRALMHWLPATSGDAFPVLSLIHI